MYRNRYIYSSASGCAPGCPFPFLQFKLKFSSCKTCFLNKFNNPKYSGIKSSLYVDAGKVLFLAEEKDETNLL